MREGETTTPNLKRRSSAFQQPSSVLQLCGRTPQAKLYVTTNPPAEAGHALLVVPAFALCVLGWSQLHTCPLTFNALGLMVQCSGFAAQVLPSPIDPDVHGLHLFALRQLHVHLLYSFAQMGTC